jgi:hypothetical protein
MLILAQIAAFACVWHVLLSALYRREQAALGSRAYFDAATASAGTLMQVLLLGGGGLWFVLTHDQGLDVAPGPTWTTILCATLAKWAVDVAYMRRTGPRWYDVLHHLVSGVMIGWVLYTQSIAWFLGIAVFVAEIPGVGYFASQAVVRLELDAPHLLFGLRCLHFVVAGTIWVVAIPALTVWYVHETDYAWLYIAMCTAYNGFTGYSAYKLFTRTPRTLRKMACELAARRSPSLRRSGGEA